MKSKEVYTIKKVASGFTLLTFFTTFTHFTVIKWREGSWGSQTENGSLKKNNFDG